MQNTATTRPHCTKCGAYLGRAPDNAFGWCGACQAWAQMGGLRPTPAAPLAPVPADPVVPTWTPPWWPPYSWRHTCTGADRTGAWTYSAPLQFPDFSGITTETVCSPHC